MLFQFIQVKDTERALLFKRGNFAGVLRAGNYSYFDPFKQLTVELFSLNTTRFTHSLADYLLLHQADVVQREFAVVQTNAREIALRYADEVLVEIVAPNTRALFWKGLVDTRVEKIDIANQLVVDAALLRTLLVSRNRSLAADAVTIVQVPQHHVALLMVDGRFEKTLEAGVHGFWKVGREIKAEIVDLRLQHVEVAGQEILTRDKVPLRVNLTAGYRIADAVTAFARQAKPLEYLYKELQFGLRAAIGTRSLDELLENKGVMDDVVSAHVTARCAGFGLEVQSVGVKDIILPGEIKAILASVVAAEKAAQANVIRRREETAASRSLLNTARVMEDNPTALRLKELETLEKVTEKIDKISVFGGLDGVLKQLVKI